MTVHTPPEELGQIFDIAKPKLGVGYHYFLDDETIDPFFEGVETTYDGPVALAQDLMVINVSEDDIAVRMAETNPLVWPSQPERPDKKPELASFSKAKIPEWLDETIIKKAS